MHVFVAGATGVLGVRLIPLLVEGGHVVTGMTRTPEKAPVIEALGADAIVCDVYDRAALADAIAGARPEILVNALSDLPDELGDAAGSGGASARIRREGSRELIEAASAARVRRVVAFSVAWPLGGDEGDAVLEMERAVLDSGGVVVRCGRLHGPGTWYVDRLPRPPRIHIDEVARRSLVALEAPPGTIELTDDE
jgi:nucleoside-diphosphate-sugar epimerase